MSERKTVKNQLPFHMKWNDVYEIMVKAPQQTHYAVDYEGGIKMLYIFDFEFVKKQLGIV